MLEIFPENFKLIRCIFMEIYDLEYMFVEALLARRVKGKNTSLATTN